MTLTPPYRRVDTPRGHHYVDAAGHRVPGVTTIIGDGIPKPALVTWAARVTAEAAVDRWDELDAMPPSVRLKTLLDARYADRDMAARRGTEVHALAERLVRGETVDVPPELTGHCEAYAQFLDDWQVRPLHVEVSIASHRHGYAGTVDLIAEITDPTTEQTSTTLADIKTTRSGVFGETALQLAAYRHADVIMTPDGGDIPMPQVDNCHAIHVRADGYSLLPVEAGPQQHRAFLYAQQIAEWSDSSRSLIGQPLASSSGTRCRIIREDR